MGSRWQLPSLRPQSSVPGRQVALPYTRKRHRPRIETPMSSKLAIFLMSGILAGAGAAYLILNLPARDPTQQASQGRVAIGGPFSLIDTTGTRRTEKDYLGKPMLVFFGFTNCPDICPTSLAVLAEAMHRLTTTATPVPRVVLISRSALYCWLKWSLRKKYS